MIRNFVQGDVSITTCHHPQWLHVYKLFDCSTTKPRTTSKFTVKNVCVFLTTEDDNLMIETSVWTNKVFMNENCVFSHFSGLLPLIFLRTNIMRVCVKMPMVSNFYAKKPLKKQGCSFYSSRLSVRQIFDRLKTRRNSRRSAEALSNRRRYGVTYIQLPKALYSSKIL